jgi:hypothetical protein
MMLFKKIITVASIFLAMNTPAAGQILYVSPMGNDANPGTVQSPLKTPHAALSIAVRSAQIKAEIILREGTYYLDKPLVITSQEFPNKQIDLISYQNEKVTLSAGRRLNPVWETYRGQILKAKIDGPAFEMLFINGKQQPMARYPNYDSTASVFNGTAEDAIAPRRIANWKNPVGGYVHALHQGEWGSFHYRITGMKNNELQMEGGWQNNRPSPLHPKHRFAENILEELDAPGEWFLDRQAKTLFFYPPKGFDQKTAKLEVSNLKHIVELRGKENNPLKDITIKGIRFEHTERTIMEEYEPLLRSDWMIYRGGAVVMDNTENCAIQDSEFTNLGGNAVMVTGYNVKSGVSGSHIHHIGSSAICFVGDSSAVRSAAFGYDNFVPYSIMDKTPGPKNNHYPSQCFATDNLIHDIGKIEKQCTGVQIEIASEIHVSHNTIYKVPRAGINIGDGAWGGHLIEHNDVFETVLETGDHGAFNSWGRDRFWHPDRQTMDSLAAAHPELILLDAQKPVTIRYNRFKCDHGWDVDLDDGSSNYHIYNNVLLSGGLKFREGFYRIAENNIMINNSFHPHVWFKNSGDVFRRNIIMRPYFPILVKDWGKEIDYNLFASAADLKKAQSDLTDAHSKFGDAQFTDPAKGNYEVRNSSAALSLGFKNFPMNDFGTRKKELQSIAQKISFPVLLNAELEKTMQDMTWLGVKIRNVHGLGDRSAFGLPNEKGVVVVHIPANSTLAKSGLQPNDVIVSANKEATENVVRLEAIRQQINWTGQMDVEIIRNQRTLKLKLNLK